MDHTELDKESLARTVRTRLVHISDELAALSPDSFAAKHALNVEGDELRNALDELEGDQSALLDAWAERAARKGIPATDEELLAEAVMVAKGSVGSAAN